MTRKSSALYLILILILAGCGNDTREEEEVYEVRGRYLSTQIGGESFSVIHEAIPDVMHAMRMELRTDDQTVSERFQTGDIIAFEMIRTERGWYARNIEMLPPDTELELPDALRDVGTP